MARELVKISETDLATRAAELGWDALQAVQAMTDPAVAGGMTHDIKAIRDRIAKMHLDFEAMFPWAVAWLGGIRQTGRLISAGQEAETIVGHHGKGRTSGNRLLLDDLGLDKMQASRWQRLADIHDEDFRTWYEEFRNNREQPTFSRLMALWRLLFKDPEWEPLPEGTFSVVYADPPWDFTNEFAMEMKGQTASDQYATVSTPKLCELPVAGKSPVLFLWVPNAMLMRDGRMVMEAWGYEYKTCMVWVKPRGPSLGWWLKNRHETLLIGTTDKAHPPKLRPPSVIESPVARHSTKPDAFYGAIEAAFDGPYLELFARRSRNGQWTCWGNEVNEAV
jgi:N6-adenosine-specific RNA methylase IME4